MVESWPVVGGTGHRPQHLASELRWAQLQAHRLAVKVRDKHGTTTAVTGLALGWDTWWAQAALDAGLNLWVHIPFLAQPNRWPTADRQEWARLRAAAVKETVYGPDPGITVEATRLFHARNRGMVNVSDAMTCLWDPAKRSGGTWQAVRLVVASRKPAIHLNPAARTVRLGLSSLVAGDGSRQRAIDEPADSKVRSST